MEFSLALACDVRGLKRRTCDIEQSVEHDIVDSSSPSGEENCSNSTAVHTKNGSHEQKHAPFRGDLSCFWKDLILSLFVKKIQSCSFSHS